jgi:hypothetical protein
VLEPIFVPDVVQYCSRLLQRAANTTEECLPAGARLAALFAAFLKHPTSPYVIGDQIRQVVESNSWQLRYAAGPHSPRIFKWRAQTTDEEWVSLFGGSDENFAAAVQRGLGLEKTL